MSSHRLGRVLLIANPAANSGRVSKVAPRARDAIRAARSASEVELVYTGEPGHAKLIAAASEGWDTVAALGGDGVTHEVANGLMKIPAERRPVLMAVPFGSGNDFARSIGMKAKLDDAFALLDRLEARAIDVGLCNDEVFLETVSFGLDAAIAQDTVALRRRTGMSGVPLYAASGIDNLVNRLEKYEASISLNGGAAQRVGVHLLAVQNGRTYGGGFPVCPEAAIDDGLLDLCWVEGPQRLRAAALTFLLAMKGTHVNRAGVRLSRATAASIAFDREVPGQIDGESFNGSSFEVAILPRALRVAAPPVAEQRATRR
ncbi:diacylglycerol kinase family lipid kinase [Berryella wangjianweii]|uniref:Diacylglycerol kinase family lipid kinase n=1 Tax=Berryella wangjianweii TaxID=2734634 RepID=A0A6M8IVX3_9ACTN|nr:diacylglycerol kinase family protein [Berryella wangjianweii]QKF06755.1 diacylglycerol kinase family lipid kinase [Berryella wangjianweii]